MGGSQTGAQQLQVPPVHVHCQLGVACGAVNLVIGRTHLSQTVSMNRNEYHHHYCLSKFICFLPIHYYFGRFARFHLTRFVLRSQFRTFHHYQPWRTFLEPRPRVCAVPASSAPLERYEVSISHHKSLIFCLDYHAIL